MTKFFKRCDSIILQSKLNKGINRLRADYLGFTWETFSGILVGLSQILG